MPGQSAVLDNTALFNEFRSIKTNYFLHAMVSYCRLLHVNILLDFYSHCAHIVITYLKYMYTEDILYSYFSACSAMFHGGCISSFWEHDILPKQTCTNLNGRPSQQMTNMFQSKWVCTILNVTQTMTPRQMCSLTRSGSASFHGNTSASRIHRIHALLNHISPFYFVVYII